ncbi:MAG: alpha-amylase family glycosyl hydrolase [Bacteroidota bacterium]
MTFRKLLILISILTAPVKGQDSVDVTFRYKPPAGQTSVSVIGEMNAWTAPGLPMTPGDGGFYTRTVRLRVGGHIGGAVTGAYQYKFYPPPLQNVPWPNDSLNHHVNTNDNNNSLVYTRNPTIYHFLPNQRTGPVRSGTPTISAYLFPGVGAAVDTGSIVLTIGDREYRNIGHAYDPSTKHFEFTVPDRLPNGSYNIWLAAGTSLDSVSITVQAGFVQLTNIGDFTTRNPLRTLYGIVEDDQLDSVRIVRNESDTLKAPVFEGRFTLPIPLVEGENSFKALATDSTGVIQISDPVRYSYFVNHAPEAEIYFLSAGGDVLLSADGSKEPDGQPIIYAWSSDPRNPEPVPGVDESSAKQLTVTKPSIPGEYFFTLIAADPDGNKDTTKGFFTIRKDGQFENSTLASVPRWAREGRMYEMFFNSMTNAPDGQKINAAAGSLPYIRSLGVNILWLMPIMENASKINNQTGRGYNIKDFFTIAPEYGTRQDFKNFVQQAHQLGIRVILDVTPNHTSYAHPFVLHARQFRESSPYWSFYQHSYIPHNSNNLGDNCQDNGFYYYCGFSSQLLNYNWADIDARTFMIEVYKWWIKEYDIDGYRFDVYWGPHRRAGNEQEMGIPVRKALKKIKPDILLLAEDDGTGSGTEGIFADRLGGVDAGYDWRLYWNAVQPFSFSSGSVEALHNGLYNSNFYPGPNSLFLRFMENHDEERIAYHYNSYEKTMPVATALFTAPGLPMIYSGQEVGFGYGLPGTDQTSRFRRTRGVINWETPGKAILLPHYQRLTHIRGQFEAFTTQGMVRVPSGVSTVYAFSRPLSGNDGVVAVDLGGSGGNVTLTLNQTHLGTQLQNGSIYYASDLYNDTTYTLTASGGLLLLPLSLPPYGSAILVISDSAKRVTLPLLVSVGRDEGVGSVPSEFMLHQNFPNPFNPSTTITYSVPHRTPINLKVYTLLGHEVTTLKQGEVEAGQHVAVWDGKNESGRTVASGIYFVRLQAGAFTAIRKLILLR